MSGIECLSFPSCYCPNCFLIVFLNSVLFSTCLNHLLYGEVRVMCEFNFTLARSIHDATLKVTLCATLYDFMCDPL